MKNYGNYKISFKKLNIIVMMIYLLIFNLILISASTNNPFLKYDEKYQNMRRNLLSNDSFKHIRIIADYYTLDNQNSISSEYKLYIRKILNYAIKLIQIIFKVKQKSSNLQVKSCLDSINIDFIIRGVGIQADLIIFPIVNENENQSENDSLVYGKYCSLDTETMRPTAGYIVFKKYLNTRNKGHEMYNTNLVIHALFHILGFDEELFDKFLDLETNKPKKLTDVVREFQAGTLSIVSNLAIKTAQIYFDCVSLNAINIITPRMNKSVSTHWDGRLMNTDIMTEANHSENVISEITLAFMEDTGWYSVNYYTGGLFRFGKLGTCRFINSKCISNLETENSNDFCSKSGLSMCSSGRLSKGVCYIRDDISDIPNRFQYFDKSVIGGPKSTRYCPIMTMLKIPSNSDKIIENYYMDSCTLGENKLQIKYGETTGLSSACFLTNLARSNDVNFSDIFNSNTAVCYEYKCDYKEFKYNVSFRGGSYPCPESGKITVDNYEGFIFCPSFSLICTKLIECTDLIDCILYKSEAFYNPFMTNNIANNNQILKKSDNRTNYYNSTFSLIDSIEGNKIDFFVDIKEYEVNQSSFLYNCILMIFFVNLFLLF